MTSPPASRGDLRQDRDGSVSGENSPTAKHSAPGSPPELRASHADRDRAVDVLRIAAGDGLLTADELDERLETALSARTLSELAVLTADLPTAPTAARRGSRRSRTSSGSSRSSAARSSGRAAGYCRGDWSSR
ncbi:MULTISPECIES: DUF1707 domain-containing protein [unclassified Streptomyces]|uniref:DUF1707 SHOCT-like domain-containing protein n=1 Tax=unclassified Streptomyces TaxID=2593676 RepID=UPI0035E0EA14